MNKITDNTLYELYFDLWGFSLGWVETIQNSVLDCKRISTNDAAESYTCPACMSVRFVSDDWEYTQEVKKKIQKLYNLANKTYSDAY